MDIKLKIYLLRKNGFKLDIVWVPGHKGISGMIKADSLAKSACDIPNIFDYNFSHRNLINLASNTRLNCNHENLVKWAETPGFRKYVQNTPLVRLSNDLEITRDWSRHSVVRYLRLLSGNCADIPFLFKIKKRESEICVCGHEKATIEHELWDCVQNSVARVVAYEALGNLGWIPPFSLPFILQTRNADAIKIILRLCDDIDLAI